MLNGCLIELFQLVVVENELIAPSPAVVAIVVVDFIEAAEHVLNVLQSPVKNIVSQTLLFTFGEQKTGKVNPTAFAHFRLGHSQESFLDGALQHGTHINT